MSGHASDDSVPQLRPNMIVFRVWTVTGRPAARLGTMQAATTGSTDTTSHRPRRARGVYGVDRLTPMPSELTTCPHCGEPGIAVQYRDAAGAVLRSECCSSRSPECIGRQVPALSGYGIGALGAAPTTPPEQGSLSRRRHRRVTAIDSRIAPHEPFPRPRSSRCRCTRRAAERGQPACRYCRRRGWVGRSGGRQGVTGVHTSASRS